MGPCVSGTSSLFLEYLLHYCDLSDTAVEVVVWNGVSYKYVSSYSTDHF